MNFNFYQPNNTANDVKSDSNHYGVTKICTGCRVYAASNNSVSCKNCSMVFVKVVKVKSLTDMRGKITKCCPDPECNEPAKSNRALKCKLCNTPFVIKVTSKRKAVVEKKVKTKKIKLSHVSQENYFKTRGTKCCPDPECNEPAKSNRALKCKRCATSFVIETPLVKKAKKKHAMDIKKMGTMFQNDPLIDEEDMEDMEDSFLGPLVLSRASSLQEISLLDSFEFGVGLDNSTLVIETDSFELGLDDPTLVIDDFMANIIDDEFMANINDDEEEVSFTEKHNLVFVV